MGREDTDGVLIVSWAMAEEVMRAREARKMERVFMADVGVGGTNQPSFSILYISTTVVYSQTSNVLKVSVDMTMSLHPLQPIIRRRGQLYPRTRRLVISP